VYLHEALDKRIASVGRLHMPIFTRPPLRVLCSGSGQS